MDFGFRLVIVSKVFLIPSRHPSVSGAVGWVQALRKYCFNTDLLPVRASSRLPNTGIMLRQASGIYTKLGVICRAVLLGLCRLSLPVVYLVVWTVMIPSRILFLLFLFLLLFLSLLLLLFYQTKTSTQIFTPPSHHRSTSNDTNNQQPPTPEAGSFFIWLVIR